MKRAIVGACLLASVFLVSGDFAKPAQAANVQAFIGEFCWRLDPFVDTLRLALSSAGSTLSINGRWVGATVYSIAVSGALSSDAVNGGTDITLTWADYNDTASYTPAGGFFHAKLTSGANGVWKYRRDDGGTNNGTFTFLSSCPAGSSTATGPTAQQ